MHKASIISHLSWLCLFLGFHTLGLYIHNDTVVAFGESEKQILIEAVFGKIIQESKLWQSEHFVKLRCATGKYFQVLGNIHDIESYFGIDNVVSLHARLFLTHWGQLAIIFMWVSGNLFHIAWHGNYELWVKNPIKTTQ